jgi:hypothetical protein
VKSIVVAVRVIGARVQAIDESEQKIVGDEEPVCGSVRSMMRAEQEIVGSGWVIVGPERAMNACYRL